MRNLIDRPSLFAGPNGTRHQRGAGLGARARLAFSRLLSISLALSLATTLLGCQDPMMQAGDCRGDADCPTPVAAAMPGCNSSGYCWENPLPQGNRLNKVVVVGPDDAWAVGDYGTIVHWTSAATTLPASGVTRNLYGIGASGTDLYAVGEAGTILHMSGGTWTAEPSGVATDLYDVTSSGGDVVAVGARGVILRRVGTAWTRDPIPTTVALRSITVAPSGDLYGVGDTATVAHYSAGTWTVTADAALGRSDLNSIAIPSGGTPIYITTTRGEIFRLSGGTYTPLYQSTLRMRGIAATPFGIVAVGVSDYGEILTSTDGTTFTRQSFPDQPTLLSVAAGSSEVVVVGDIGAMLRYDGTSWAALSSGSPYPLKTIHGVDDMHIWAGGLHGALLSRSGSSFTQYPSVVTLPNFFSIFAISASDVWGVEGYRIWHWNGVSWSEDQLRATGSLNAVWAASATQVYAVGSAGTAYFYDGTSWSPINSGTGLDLKAITGSGPSDIWAGGDKGVVLHSTGGGFSLVPGALSATSTVGGIWAEAPNNVYFAADTNIFHYDGSTYTKTATAVSGLRAISGERSEVWAVGNGGAVLHYDGLSWNQVETGTRHDFYGIFLSPSNQFLVGDFGTVLSTPR